MKWVSVSAGWLTAFCFSLLCALWALIENKWTNACLWMLNFRSFSSTRASKQIQNNSNSSSSSSRNNGRNDDNGSNSSKSNNNNYDTTSTQFSHSLSLFLHKCPQNIEATTAPQNLYWNKNMYVLESTETPSFVQLDSVYSVAFWHNERLVPKYRARSIQNESDAKKYRLPVHPSSS